MTGIIFCRAAATSGEEHLGYPAHADAADADEMNVSRASKKHMR
jgi:hypothetical protein